MKADKKRKAAKRDPGPKRTASLAERMSWSATHRRRTERQIEALEAEVAWLYGALKAANPGGAELVGACARCGEGVVTRNSDTLRCDACGYVRYL